jgi:hypothetical protein
MILLSVFKFWSEFLVLAGATKNNFVQVHDIPIGRAPSGWQVVIPDSIIPLSLLVLARLSWCRQAIVSTGESSPTRTVWRVVEPDLSS